MRDVFIYALVDPLDNQIRYVGQSVDPTKRLLHHVLPSGLKEKNYKANWMKQLSVLGLQPKLIILEKTLDAFANDRERFFIRIYGSFGFKLTNMTQGGQDGGSTLIPVVRIDPKTGEEKKYDSVKDTEKDGFKATCVTRVCKGKHVHHGGYRWQYIGQQKNTKNSKIKHPRKILRSVTGINLLTKEKVIFSSPSEAQKAGYSDRRIIRRICQGERFSNHGWTWRWT